MSSVDTPHFLLDPLRQVISSPHWPCAAISHASRGAVAWLAASLAQQRPAPVVIVSGKTTRSEALNRELLFYTGQWRQPPRILPFPAWEVLPFEPLSPYGPLVGERIATLHRLTQMSGHGPVRAADESGHPRAVLLTTPMALMQRLIPPTILARHGFAVTVGDQLDLPAFRTFLVLTGYRAATQVEEPGEFAVRGGIIDFYPPNRDAPVRIELFGDEVESLRAFDPLSQRSADPLRRVQALPVSEVLLNEETISAFRTRYRTTFGGAAAEDELYKVISAGRKYAGMEHYLPLFYEGGATLFDYLPPDTLFLLEEEFDAAAAERQREIDERHRIAVHQSGWRCLPPQQFYLDQAELQQRLAPFAALRVAAAGEAAALDLGVAAHPSFPPAEGKEAHAVLDQVASHLRALLNGGARVAVAARTVSQRERLREILEDHHLKAADASGWEAVCQAPPGSLWLAVGDLTLGFHHPAAGLALLSENEIYGPRVRRRSHDRRYLDQLIASFADLGEGNLVVHADHGIGRYGGLHALTVDNLRNDFLLLTYAGDDKLYVPVENLDRVSKFSGSEEAVLDKLGATRWQKTKQRARREILAMAEDLIHLQAKRQAQNGFAFSPPDALDQEFAASFPFDETPDQEEAIRTVLADLASPRPMDRLVCGDVGFGKTEVALRAVFRAVMDGKQAAILVPTTILAQQHFESCVRRFAPYPVRVELLSRYRTPLQQKAVLEGVRQGVVEVVVGTHRLLQEDVDFARLGLLVVDEEQRFGVTHKEKIKRLRATVDILTLTATPIPRTLHMAMAGVRDISIIATPPADRLAIRTIVTQYNPQLVREAILRELYRGGQVFYLYNQVADIDKKAADLAALVPEAKVGVAHGQMREAQLERVMLAFYKQEFNLLVCSTIIENGVDIPSANTILIHRADKFGLAQLHQLRGRVGRSKHRAYAYLLIPHPQRLGDEAQKRLDALERLGDLGSGFMLATHDLEIRGAGNILGDQQSGQIHEVGFELYHQMLREAIAALQAGHDLAGASAPADEEPAPEIRLNLSSYIPEEYLPDVHQRLTLYKRIAGLASHADIDDMRAELTDRFGKPPETLENLLEIMHLKLRCRAQGILKLEAGPKGAKIQFPPQPRIRHEALITLLANGRGNVTLERDQNILRLKNRAWEAPATRLRELGNILAGLSLT